MTNTNFHRGNGYPTPTPSPPEHANSHLEDDSSVTVIASSRAVVGGRLTEATIVVSRVTGKITAIYDSIIPPYEFAYGTHYVDYSPHILMPGLVDAHVHLNEPGRTEWEGFWTGTRAAAFGGVTTVIDMPLNAIPPTTTVENLQIKMKAAQGQCWVDVGFYGGIVPGNASELKGLVKEGVRGFKGFLIDSGVDEFPAVSSGDIAKVMAELKDEKTVLMFHAEMIPPISDSVGDSVQMSDPPLAPAGPLYEYATFLSSRPSSFETYAIGEILSLAHLAPQLPLHIVHLSAIEAIPMLREARAQGVNITAETCFHYLALAAERVQHGDTRHKCCPPIRTQKNQDGLWDEILRTGNDSVIQTVVSDHSPCTPNLKLLPASLERVGVAKTTPASVLEASTDSKGNFFAAWGGISSVGLGLPILWTAGRRHNISIEDVVRWCCINTAAQVGLSHQKGDLKVGLDADFCVFDDTREWMLGRESMLFRNKVSPYEGKVMRGMVKETWVRGVRIFAREERGVAGFVNGKATGKLLLEPRTT